jgi:hypothetical protein
MDIFSLNSSAGSAAGSAAFLMVRELIDHLQKAGVLVPSDIDKLVVAATSHVPSINNPLKSDTRALLESLKR